MTQDKEVFDYLYTLADTGITNILDAGPYIEKAFKVDNVEARRLLKAWIMDGTILTKQKEKIMKPREKKPEIVYRIIDKETGIVRGSYSRAYCDEFDFNSCEEARRANCHGMFENKAKYKIAKYRVTYELLDENVDNA